MTSQAPIDTRDVSEAGSIADVFEAFSSKAINDEMLLTELRRFIDQGLKLVEAEGNEDWQQKIVLLSCGDAFVVPEALTRTGTQIILRAGAHKLARDDFRIHQSDVATIIRIRELFATVATIESEARNTGELSDTLKRMLKEILLLSTAVKAEDFRIRVERDQTSLFIVLLDTAIPFKTLTVSEGKALCQSFHSASSGHSNTQYLEHEKQVCQLSANDPKHPGNKRLIPEAVETVRIAFTNIAGGHRLMTGRVHYSKNVHKFTLKDFGYTPEQQAAFRRFRSSDGGGCVFSGPMNSGKNTALALNISQMMRERPGRIVMTIEDPVEIIIEGADQMSIENTANSGSPQEEGEKAVGIVFRSKAHDLYMSEVKENSALGPLFINAAISGQNAWTTTHSKTAPGVIDRFISLKLNQDMIFDSSTLQLLVSQRLIKKVCPKCSVPLEQVLGDDDHPDVELLRAAVAMMDDDIGAAKIKGEGCSHCEEALLPTHVRNSLAAWMPRASLDRLKMAMKELRGYVGRTLIAEVLEPDKQFMDLYQHKGKVAATEYWVHDKNGFRLYDHALMRIREGFIDPRDASLFSLKYMG